MCISSDPEFNQLLGRVVITQGGVKQLSDKQIQDRYGFNKKSKDMQPSEDMLAQPMDMQAAEGMVI